MTGVVSPQLVLQEVLHRPVLPHDPGSGAVTAGLVALGVETGVPGQKVVRKMPEICQKVAAPPPSVEKVTLPSGFG